MDDNQKKALAIYLAVALGIGFLGHSKVVGPIKIRQRTLQNDLDGLQDKKTALQSCKQDFETEQAKLNEVKDAMAAMLERFPKPKELRGDQQQIRVYDTFMLSEQVSSAARGLLLKPKDMLDPEHFIYQSLRIQEEDLNAKGDTMQDQATKVSLEPDKAKINNFLKVEQPRFRYEVSGDFRTFLEFVSNLNRQKTYLDLTALDLFQKGQTGTAIQANITVSCLDFGDGLFNPAAGQ